MATYNERTNEIVDHHKFVISLYNHESAKVHPIESWCKHFLHYKIYPLNCGRGVNNPADTISQRIFLRQTKAQPMLVYINSCSILCRHSSLHSCPQVDQFFTHRFLIHSWGVYCRLARSRTVLRYRSVLQCIIYLETVSFLASVAFGAGASAFSVSAGASGFSRSNSMALNTPVPLNLSENPMP